MEGKKRKYTREKEKQGRALRLLHLHDLLSLSNQEMKGGAPSGQSLLPAHLSPFQMLLLLLLSPFSHIQPFATP